MPRLLHVTIFEGVGLAEHREPYVVVELLDISGRPIKHERAKTKVAPYGPTVVWTADGSTGGSPSRGYDEEKGETHQLLNPGVHLRLGQRHDLRNVGALPTLRISVWGHERIAKERPLGIALMDVALLPGDGTPAMKWMELEPAVGMVPDTPCGSPTGQHCVSPNTQGPKLEQHLRFLVKGPSSHREDGGILSC